MPEIYYIESSFGCEDDATLYIRWNSARIILHLFRNPQPDAKEDQLIDQYLLVSDEGDEDIYQDAQDAILDTAVAVGEPEFDRLAPPPPELLRQLHAILFPSQFTFKLVTAAGKLQVLLEGAYLLEVTQDRTMGFINVPPHPNPQPQACNQASLKAQLKIDSNTQVPRFSTEDIEVIEKLLDDGYISHVRVNGREMYAKICREDLEQSMQREMDCLEKISTNAAKEPRQINIPKLIGFICMPDNQTVIGVLEELVPVSKEQELSSLGHIDDILAISSNRRQAWASQIRRTVDWLHENNIIGDMESLIMY